ncbi:hypothetical protein AQUCO_04500178v1 [Aquilegia coerulea]|uniref:RING-type E3 ubiquitin transferase n=1 Tax=Aquilegia coerulea TaxID=218851 RepID=A0A2G5CM74_AQUCA|nr:hypothetical protein AQUCO_04500178v1 [Aquilegia coerulea]
MASPWHYNNLDDNNFKLGGHFFLVILLVFSFVLLSTILFLFIKWTCKYRNIYPSTTTITTNNNTTITTVQSVGLDSIIIDNLPILLHHASSSLNDEEAAQCSICLSTFLDQEKVKILPGCNHTYHPDCVDKWLKTHSNCPLCRSSLLADSAVS